MNETMNNDGNV